MCLIADYPPNPRVVSVRVTILKDVSQSQQTPRLI